MGKGIRKKNKRKGERYIVKFPKNQSLEGGQPPTMEKKKKKKNLKEKTTSGFVQKTKNCAKKKKTKNGGGQGGENGKAKAQDWKLQRARGGFGGIQEGVEKRVERE